jgi:hypothetical protein
VGQPGRNPRPSPNSTSPACAASCWSPPRRRGTGPRRHHRPPRRCRRAPPAGCGHRRRGVPPRQHGPPRPRSRTRPQGGGQVHTRRAGRGRHRRRHPRHPGHRGRPARAPPRPATRRAYGGLRRVLRALERRRTRGPRGRRPCPSAAGATTGVPVLHYPVWTWHWARPGDPRVP